MAEEKESEAMEDKPGILMGKPISGGYSNLRESISNVLKDSKSKSDLIKMSMAEGEPLKSFKLTYDAPTSQLEPIYFWLLDFIQDMGIEVKKVTDNFTSTPGSGHFAEMGARATRMQDEGMKILASVNQIVKTVLNLIYDLKEYEIRLEHYKDANSDEKELKQAGMLALKQIWLDQVDLKRGRGSIHQMSYEMGFTTLRDSFMIANSVEDVRKNEIINEQVKRILIPRMSEFLKWKEYSEKELKKRFEIEKSYLKTEVESLKLYTSWVRPYLKAAEELRMKGFERNPALVHAFNTTMFDLVLFGKLKYNGLPPGIKNYNMKRDYYSCFIVSFVFRGLPQKVTQQHYGFGGRVDINFDCYTLNEDELKMIDRELEKKDVEEGVKFIQDATDNSLEEFKEDLDHFLNDDGERKKQEEKKKNDNTNPFSALFEIFRTKKKDKKEKKKISESKEIKKDNFVEWEVRRLAGNTARQRLYLFYDIYKKAHGMASSPEDFDLGIKETGEEVHFVDLFKK